jgi:prepilin signal peptidase PulO-like enzyme (type II secretory pathway)
VSFAVVAGTALLFALAGWIGVAVADLLCAGYLPNPDGPEPIRFERRHLVVAAACVGIAVAARMPSLPQLAIGTIAIFALAGCAAADLACGMLPDVLTLGPLLVVFGFSVVSENPLPAAGAAFVFLPFAAAAFFSRGRGMGWGDVKLATFGGALLGAKDATLALFAAGMAAFLIARHSGLRGKPIAFGPYLAASIAATFALLGIH